MTGIVRFLRFKLYRPSQGTIVTLTDRLVINFDYPKQFIGALVVFKEPIEPEYQFLRKALRKDSVFFDVGAGIGAYAMCAANLVNGPVHAFEPIAENVRTIRNNLTANHMESKVKLNTVALSDKEGFGHMSRHEHCDLFVSELLDISTEYDPGAVKVTTLDSYCAHNGVKAIDVIKIDVEGHEPSVIKGADRLICQENIRLIILETDHRLEQFYNSLQDRGFHFFYYDYRSNALEQIYPICARTLLNEPSAFSSNIILILNDALDVYRHTFPIVFHH